MTFPEFVDINIGEGVENFIEWLTINHSGFFDAIRDGILGFLLKMQDFLNWIPWFVIIAVIFLAGWKVKNIKSGIIYSMMLFLIGLMGYWEAMILTISVVLTAVIISKTSQ